MSKTSHHPSWHGVPATTAAAFAHAAVALASATAAAAGYQRRRVERLPRLLACHLRTREFAQLVVHQRQELLRGVCIAGFNHVQDLGYVGYADSEFASRGAVTASPS